MAEVSQTGKSKLNAKAFQKDGDFPARVKRKAAAAAQEERRMRTPDAESHVAPLARGYRALRRVE